MIILLASSGSLSGSSVIPAAHASSNANLFVSVENSQYNNYFAGPQVVQVVVSDPDINRLDQAYGEPTVTVNGKKLRMMQNTDGNWYAYFADSKQAQIADSTAAVKAKGLNFGQLCSPVSGQNATGIDFSETKGFFIANSAPGSTNGTQNPAATVHSSCTGTATGPRESHVVRENKTLTPQNGGVAYGQLGIKSSNAWPIIQLYDFASIPSTVTVQYQKAGGVQSTTLTFDRIPVNLISSSIDRTAYPKNAMVFITMNDPQLNIDPTEEDSWTWGANASNSTLYYQAFDRNGRPDADGTAGMQNLIGNLTAFLFNHNGKFTLHPAAGNTRVVDFEANGKQLLNGTTTARGDPAHQRTQSIGLNSEPITFIESGGTNTGVFRNWDGSMKSNIVTVNNNSIRGQQATFRYNDFSQSIVGGFSFGSISMTTINGTWPSGSRIPVTLTDSDANLNSKITEHLNAYDPNVKRLATEKIGTPFSLNAANSGLYPSGPESASFVNGTTFTQIGSGNYSVAFNSVPNTHVTTTTNLSQDEGFSNRPIFAPNNEVFLTTTSPGSLVVDLHTTMQTLRNTIHNANSTIPPGNNPENFRGFNLFGLDARSLSTLTNVTGTSSISKVSVYLLYKKTGGDILNGTGGPVSGLNAISIVNSTDLQAFANLNTTSSMVQNPVTLNHNLFKIPKSSPIGLMFTFTVSGAPGAGTLILATNNGLPVMADFYSVGLTGDGKNPAQRINNGVYRFELEETGDNTGVFTGTNEYGMLNQVSIFDSGAYSNLRIINHDVKFPVVRNMLQSDGLAPQVSYLDLGQDGVDTQQSAQQDVQTITGAISFDSNHYNPGDTATITLNDPDKNTDSELLDIYIAVPSGNDPAADTIGKAGLGVYSDGSSFGRLFDIKFNGTRWAYTGCFPTNSATGTPGGFPTSLSADGISLVETGPATGVLTGVFTFPDQFCSGHTAVSTSVVPLVAEYADFTNDLGAFQLIKSSQNIISFDIKDQNTCQSLPSGSPTWNQGNATCTVTNFSLKLGTFGSLGVENGITLLIKGGNLTNGGSITNNGVIINYGILDNQAQLTNLGSLNNLGALKNSPHGTITNSGVVNNIGKITNGGTISSSGTINNIGTLHQNTGSALSSSGHINNVGSLENGGNMITGGTTNNFGTVTNYSHGNISNNGALANFNMIIDSGIIINNCGGTVSNLGTITGHPILNAC